MGRGIYWEARKPGPAGRLPHPSPARPKPTSPPDLAFLGPFRVVDARLKEIAKAGLKAAEWKAVVERLSDTISEAERMATYRAVRDAAVLPSDVTLFLFDHALQWLPSENEDLDRHVEASLRRHGLDDLADLHARDRLEFDRRRERGRQFFYGPPDEGLAERLREKGIID